MEKSFQGQVPFLSTGHPSSPQLYTYLDLMSTVSWDCLYTLLQVLFLLATLGLWWGSFISASSLGGTERQAKYFYVAPFHRHIKKSRDLGYKQSLEEVGGRSFWSGIGGINTNTLCESALII